MNFLVLGGSGFLGKKTCHKLAESGHFVRVYSPSASSHIFHRGVTAINGLIYDINEINRHIDWADIIVHYISVSTPHTSLLNPYQDLTGNLLPFLHLLDKVKERPERKKIIFCSSGGAVYGQATGYPIIESHPRNPTTPYGIVKSVMEDYIQFYHQQYGIRYLIMRPSNVYGLKLRSIGQQGIVSTLIHNSLHDLETIIWTNPENVRDFLFIDDFADGFMSLVNKNVDGIFNLGTGKGYSINEVITMVAEAINIPVHIRTNGHVIQDEVTNVLDVSKIFDSTGWKAKTTLKEGIELIVKQYSESSSFKKNVTIFRKMKHEQDTGSKVL